MADVKVGFLLWPPVALLPLLFVASGSVWLTVAAPALPILAWLAYVGMSVPAAVIERLDFRHALGRGIELGRADYVHVLGTLFTLVIAYHLSAGVLFLLLQGGSKLQLSIAGFLATLVISPTIFLGAALVYFDQAARADPDKVRRPTERSTDADLYPPLDADGSGGADAEVEPEPAARGES